MNYTLHPLETIRVLDLLALHEVPILETRGNRDVVISGKDYIKSLEISTPGTLSFCYQNPHMQNSISRNNATAIIVDIDLKDNLPLKSPQQLHIFVEDAHRTFVTLIRKLVTTEQPTFLNVEDIPISCYIGPNVIIERGAKIGENVQLVGNTYIYRNVQIGNNIIIKPGNIIGGQGFGLTLEEGGVQQHFPHIGGVIIEDNVRIGANVCIDCGSIGNTILRRGCRIDNLCHIAHNVEVGENTCVVAACMIAGSVKIGNNTWVGPGSSVLQQLSIGDDVMVGMHSCVLRNVPNNKLVYGVPAHANERHKG